ncbi:hypothetical protein [Paenibacillus xerothermodurans]|uniref:Uncharacterized protein n=1 Tax=Paenibacillus xerothermodurans TaxID=1977292 RepID=A0A2W1NCF2_PAEXE|nr:hypothetical protein [Paenibacillus xerothermodurans]PZE21340.1 hypothetical protein CBW46_008240 [Paenibacillus xerothermodurans]
MDIPQLDERREKQLRETFSGMKKAIDDLQNHMNRFDYTIVFQLAHRLKSNPDLLHEFMDSPAAVFERETGMSPPPATQIHFVNNQNQYYPAEGSAEKQDGQADDTPWGRVEYRFAMGPGCIAIGSVYHGHGDGGGNAPA